MGTVRMIVKDTDKLSAEEIKELHESKKEPITFDEDSPQMTAEMLAKFKRVNPKENALP